MSASVGSCGASKRRTWLATGKATRSQVARERLSRQQTPAANSVERESDPRVACCAASSSSVARATCSLGSVHLVQYSQRVWKLPRRTGPFGQHTVQQSVPRRPRGNCLGRPGNRGLRGRRNRQPPAAPLAADADGLRQDGLPGRLWRALFHRPSQPVTAHVVDGGGGDRVVEHAVDREISAAERPPAQ